MKSSSIRVALDGALTILLIASMLAQLTGVIAHEIIGVVFLLAVVAHMVNSFKWMKSVASLVENAQVKEGQLAFFVVAVLLGITFAVLVISSVPISRLLYQAGLAPKIMSSMWLSVHKISAFLLCILAVVHLAMHWTSVLKHLSIPYDPSKRKTIGMGVKVISCAGIAALGVIGFNSLELFTGAGEDAAANGTTQAGSAQKGSTASTSSPGAAGSSAGSGTAAGQSAGTAAASGEATSGAGTPGAGAAGTSSDSASAVGTSSSSANRGGNSDDNNDNNEARPSTSQADGTCPLCHKHCPLSDPQCDKPYRAGLIAS